jgi:hypothetical protein
MNRGPMGYPGSGRNLSTDTGAKLLATDRPIRVCAADVCHESGPLCATGCVDHTAIA